MKSGEESAWWRAWRSVHLGTETEFLIFEERRSSIWTPGPPELKGLAGVDVLRDLIPLIARLEGSTEPVTREEIVITNGSRIYIDPPYLEHATAVQPAADVGSTLTTIAAEYAAERMIVAATREFEAHEGIGLRVFKTLAWGGLPLETSAGYHENYGMSRGAYFRLFREDNHRPRPILDRVVIPFLVTRIVWAGAGTFERESGSFHASQRAEYIDSVYSLSTSVHHPILHLKRPSPTADRLRVHITCGDPARNWDSSSAQADLDAVVASAMRLAITAGVLSFAAEGLLDSVDLRLRDPVAAFRGVSRSPLDYRMDLMDGSSLTAIEVQRTLRQAMADTVGEPPPSVA